MASTAKYSPIEHGGLEAVDQNNAPEVVPSPPLALDRRNSDNSPEATYKDHGPEVVHPGQYQDGAEKDYYGSSHGTSSAPSYDGQTAPAYFNTKEKLSTIGVQEHESSESQQSKRRRICGMQPWVFAVVIVVTVLVILGAVLGGVLGTLLTKHSSSSITDAPAVGVNSSESTGPIEAYNNTGLATALLYGNSDLLSVYYQDPDGKIIENIYNNGNWSLEDHTQINDSIVTEEAALGSPLAALSYQLNGKVYRQVFFFSPTGAVMQVNATENGNSWTWGEACTITDGVSAPSSPALAACAGEGSLNGIRVYYGITTNNIQVVGLNYTNPGQWYDDVYLEESDQSSGVACSVYQTQSGNSHQWGNVYFRNTTDGRVHQTYFDYVHPENGWHTDFPASPANITIQSGSAMALCSDNDSSDYVFWRQINGVVQRAIVDPTADYWGQFDNMRNMNQDSLLAAAYIDGGSAIFYQNASSSTTVWMLNESRDSVLISNIAMP